MSSIEVCTVYPIEAYIIGKGAIEVCGWSHFGSRSDSGYLLNKCVFKR
jgi:hypothetical protein